MANEKEESAILSALGTVISVLAKIEKVWEQRLLSDKAITEVPTTVLVERQYKIGKEGEWTPPEVKADEKIAIHRYITQPATVGIEMGGTVNMGNFESARVSVTVTVPCYREEVVEATTWVKNYAEERFKAEIADARSVNIEQKKAPSPF